MSTAFWDASALVPVCIQESTSTQARALLRKFAPVVWWGSPVEVRSALARLLRSGAINEAGKQGAINRLSLLERGWREVLPDDALRALAGQLLDVYPLRAADSLQLAAALTWSQQRAAGRSFIAADQRLCEAAESAGFTVVRFNS